MIGMWARRWNAAIDTRRLYAAQFDMPAQASGWGLVHTYEAAFRGNLPAYDLKTLMVRWAQVGLVLQTVVLAATLLAIRAGV
jgi:hypothetical protein